MCKLRPGAPQDQGDEEMGLEGEEEGVYERIETVVVQVQNFHYTPKQKYVLILFSTLWWTII